jgi:CxxC-x17-CxxC domain-containing protein
MHTATCSVCGVATEVPFVPDGVRPVYCLPCLKRQTR